MASKTTSGLHNQHFLSGCSSELREAKGNWACLNYFITPRVTETVVKHFIKGIEASQSTMN